MPKSMDWRVEASLVRENNGAQLPQVDDAPHVRAEPHGCASVGLVLPDEDGVRDGQQADQSAVLKELENFRLVRQTPGKRQAR